MRKMNNPVFVAPRGLAIFPGVGIESGQPDSTRRPGLARARAGAVFVRFHLVQGI